MHTCIITSVKIHCANKSFKSMSSHITIMRRTASITQYQLADSHLICKFVQSVSLYKLTTSVCKKSFALTRKMSINNISHNSVKNSIAQKFQAFVVYRLSFCITFHNALMHQC